jgi:antitoxin component of RelBE/YafQ-DinJ toxin-antitoxin module
MNRYSRQPRNVRFDEMLLEDAAKYQKLTGISFSNLVRVALQSFLRRKLYDDE